MIIWTIKLIGAVRRAIAGRKYPHQLAWAVAFGVLLGVVPHGNLLAIGLLILVLSIKLNHAMAGLVAIGTTFAAVRLDPYSHQLGDMVLSEPRVANFAANAWQLPLVPWTDLNNTIVVGSLLIGVAALLPIFLLTYPIFRWLAPAEAAQSETSEPNTPQQAEKSSAKPGQKSDDSDAVEFEEVEPAGHEILVVNRGHKQIAKPHANPQPESQPIDVTAATQLARSIEIERTIKTDRRDTGEKGSDAAPERSTEKTERSAEKTASADSPAESPDGSDNDVAVETRIDVIRMKDYRAAKPPAPVDNPASGDGETEQQQPMDEALSYLLRQLRDSQQRKVA